MVPELKERCKMIFYISRLLYPNHHPIWFILYMHAEFEKVRKRNLKYILKRVPQHLIFANNAHSNGDVNNTVIVNELNVCKSDIILRLNFENRTNYRYVYVIKSKNCPKNELLVNETLYANLAPECREVPISYLTEISDLDFADEIDLSVISSPFNIDNAIIDGVLKSYFSAPKFILESDIVEINLRKFCSDIYYTNNKINNLDNIYLKCNKVFVRNQQEFKPLLCMIGETAIKQSPDIQAFLPKILEAHVKYPADRLHVPICPYGLQSYLDYFEKLVQPFINQRKTNLKPLFLINGKQGCGADVILKCLSLKLGMHFFKKNNSDLTANVYAQSEAKLRNMFFSARSAAPCIIFLQNFQNFGKNNEGQYDERIIGFFANESEIILKNDVILFCYSTEKNIPASLNRLFLETIEIKSPTDKERQDNLQWILDQENIIKSSLNLTEIANKTHGFFYQDLKALFYYAKLNSKKSKEQLNQTHFDKAIDYMQSNYNESLGAPKVPKVLWSDVGGLVDVKEEIIKTINLPLKHPEFFKNSGLKRTGILLFGPPGTGKTLIAKAVATECNLCFLSVKGPELLNMYVGQSEQNVREVFERARQASPCIIFFDELDSLAPNRGMKGDSGGVMDRVVSQLLAEMDGINESATIFIIGATNRPDLIDPALLRPGRFDKLLYIGPCTDLDSKISVFKALTRKFNLDEAIDLVKIVESCPANITGADFYGICSNAWTAAVRKLINNFKEDGFDSKVVVHYDDFQEAIRNVKPSIRQEDLQYFEKLKKELASNK